MEDFLLWLDDIVSKHAGPAVVVRTLNDTTVPGSNGNITDGMMELCELKLSVCIYKIQETGISSYTI